MKKIIRIILFAAFLLAAPPGVSAQLVDGTVLEKGSHGEQPLPGVNVYWLNTYTGTVTNEKGRFEIQAPSPLPARLIFSFIGYQSDTLLVTKAGTYQVILKQQVNLNEVNIERKKETTTISTITPINTQIISSGELRKAACCNLAESFETNPSVDVSFTDAVSGARQIQMLGLDGIYTQILSENVPLIRGLNSAYGLSYVPGPFVESIYVSKGVGSVVNGYESITGQINIEVNEPVKADKLFVNGYLNSDLRSELNIQLGQKVSKKVHTILFLHGSDAGIKKDVNHDSFVDGPLGQQLNLFNRWHFEGKRTEGQLGIRAVIEKRTAGQLDPDPEAPANALPYEININNRQFEVYTKTGLLFPEKDGTSIGLITSTRLNHQDMHFGLKDYDGDQVSFYSNLIYQTNIHSDKNVFKAGASFVYDDYKETYEDSVMNHHETVPGAFAEYNFNDKKKMAFILGGRADYHNLFGWFFTPRFHFKYNFRPMTVLRLSAGSGFRTAQVFTENPSIFANSRIMVAGQKLLPEKAWNVGASLTHKFKIGNKEGTFVMDYFYTSFVNQVVVDLENVHEVRFYNLDGKSYSNAYQVQLDFAPVEHFDVRLAYKRYDVKVNYSGSLLEKPFVPRDRVLLNLAYATHMDRWKFDVTFKWFGTSRIPNTSENPEIYRLESHSEEYTTINAQVTKAFRKFDLYAGAENITNYVQQNPIIAPHEPFGENFDASLVWGPLIGRVIYAGFRFTIK